MFFFPSRFFTKKKMRTKKKHLNSRHEVFSSIHCVVLYACEWCSPSRKHALCSDRERVFIFLFFYKNTSVAHANAQAGFQHTHKKKKWSVETLRVAILFWFNPFKRNQLDFCESKHTKILFA